MSIQPSDDQPSEDSLATGLSKLSVAVPAAVSTQVLESQEHLESILAALWPCEWMALPLLSKTTDRICKELGHRCAERHGIRCCRPTDCRCPLRTLAATAHVYLFGGVADSTMARHVYVLPAEAAGSGPGDAGAVDEERAGRGRYVLQVLAEKAGPLQSEQRFETRAEAVAGRGRLEREGVSWRDLSIHDNWGIRQLPLPPLPDPAQYELAAAAAGGCVYVTGDATRQLGPGQAWNWLEGEAPYMCGISDQEAHTARYDLGAGAWARVAAPPPPDAAHATPASGSLGSHRGALVHTGGCSMALTQAGRSPGVDELEPWDPSTLSVQSRYDRSVERFDGERWERLEDVPLCAPFEQPQVVFSLQLLVCAGALHAILIGFDTVTDGDAEHDAAVFGLVCGYETSPMPHARPFALFRRDEGTGKGMGEGGGWTRVVPTGAQPGSRLLGSPVVAHAERILIFGTTDTGGACVHALRLEGGGRASCRWLPPQELLPLLRDGSESEDEERRMDGSEAEDDVPEDNGGPAAEEIRRHNVAMDIDRRKESSRGPSEWTAGVALAVALR